MEESNNKGTKINTVLITGANGFMGSNLTEYLVKNTPIRVRAMVMPNTPTKLLEQFQETYGNIEIVQGNLLDQVSLDKATQGVEGVVHLASIVTEWAPWDLYQKVIIDGTANLLQAMTKNCVERMVFMSSLTVHALDGHQYADENHPRDMKKMKYGVAKRQAEDLITNWASAPSRDCALIRPGFIIYGPHDLGSFVNALEAIIKGQMMHLNKGKALLSYIYVENLCYAIHQLLMATQLNGPYVILDGHKNWIDWVDAWKKAADITRKTLSIPYGVVSPLVWLLENIYKIFQFKKSPILNLYRISIPRKDIAFSDEKMRTEIGYTPPISFEESLSRTLEYYYQWMKAKKKK